jgi:spermidine/putrescine transport system substrate-binding protein
MGFEIRKGWRMKRRFWLAATGAVMAFGLVALEASVATAQRPTLNLFNWSEYMDPAILKDFEKRFSATVVVSLFESNEDLIAKLKATGGGGYDVVVPGQYAIPLMARQGLLQPLQKAKIPNFKNLTKKFVNPNYDPGNKFSAAYQWGTVGVVYNRDKLPKPDETWGLFFDAKKQQGSFILMDSTREMLAAPLKYLGKSLNSTNKADLNRVLELMIDAKTRSLGFDGGVGARNKVSAGQANYGMAYNGDVVKLQAEDPKLGFFVPREGSLIFVDSMAIPARAPNADLAHKFVNFILDARVGARLSNYNRYATPNDAAKPFITPTDLKNPAIYPSAATMAKLEFNLDLGKDNNLYDSVWTKVKAR